MDVTIDLSENYVASEEPDTTGHGTSVLDLLRAFAPKSIYKPHRVIAEDGEFKPSNFLKTMHKIETDNIDIVNISAGKYHPNCGTNCRICHSVESVTSNDTIVVAGAGNRKENRELDVYCPAKSPGSIAVGMSETLCTANPQIDPQKSEKFDLSKPPDQDTFRPPGAYWVDHDEKSPFIPNENYCSQLACSPLHPCEENRKTEYSYGNVKWENYVPQVVAPGHYPIADIRSGNFRLDPGTSYSTAIVSGSIATVLSEIFPSTPSPELVRRVVGSTAQELECGVVGKINMQGLLDVLTQG